MARLCNAVSRISLSLAFLFPCMNQAQAVPETATLTGRILCADTNAPARFGKVVLKPAQAGGGFGDALMKRLAADNAKAAKPKELTEAQKKRQAAATRSMNDAAELLAASTIGMNGEYSLSGIKPGTYYLHAIYAGYTDPVMQFSDEDLQSSDPAVREKIAAVVPTLTITGNESAHADLRLERGASISGKVLYDDGTPAVGWSMIAVPSKATEEEATALAAPLNPALSTAVKTDDVGRYRISGLLPGTYTVLASLQSPPIGINSRNLVSNGGDGIMLAVYSGDTFSRQAAKGFTLISSTEHSGTDITVPNHKLHSILGHVYAQSDGHTPNSGGVVLTEKDHPDMSVKAAIRSDGSFHYEYLPPGSYTVTISEAADAKITGSNSLFGLAIPKQEVLRKYSTATTDVVLSDADVDSVKMTVTQTDWTPPPPKPNAKNMDPGKALGEVLGTLMTTDPDAETKEAPKK